MLEKNQSVSLLTLSPDMLFEIMTHLDVIALVQFSRVSQQTFIIH